MLLACGLTALPAVASPVILAWGDSLCAAYGLQESEGWVALMDARLKAQGYDYTVVNGCVSGETTAGGLARMPAAIAQHKPAIVILELGSNDALRGTPTKVIRDNLGQMIRLSKQAGAKILLLGMLMPPNYGAEYTREFESAFLDISRQYGTAYLHFLLKGVADHPDLMQGDDMHPTAVGEPIVLDNVWPALKPLLKKSTP